MRRRAAPVLHGDEIGRDHIASTVYTIAFGWRASLGVFLLIKINKLPLLDMLQTEQFAAEVLSILVGSMGLLWLCR